MNRIPNIKYLFLILICILACACTDDDAGCNDPDACADFTASDGSCVYICLTESEKSRVISFVETGVAKINSDGRESAFEAFETEDGDFIDEELYIFVIDLEGNMLSHGFQPELIGQNLYDLQDIHGKYIIRDLLEVTESADTGWSWYYWEDPLTNATEKKFSFVQKVGDIIVGAGTYKQ